MDPVGPKVRNLIMDRLVDYYLSYGSFPAILPPPQPVRGSPHLGQGCLQDGRPTITLLAKTQKGSQSRGEREGRKKRETGRREGGRGMKDPGEESGSIS